METKNLRSEMLNEIVEASRSNMAVLDECINELGVHYKTLEIHTDNYQTFIEVVWLEGSFYADEEAVEVWTTDGEKIKLTTEESEILLTLID